MAAIDIANDWLALAAQYGRDVMNGKIVVGRFVRLAVERHYRDLEEGPYRGLFFCEESALRALAFFTFLRHSKGEWSGQPVVLEPWQCWIIACVFGWKIEDTGRRRFRMVYEEIARKNGKTTKLAGIGTFGLIKDDEGGPEVYSAATKRDQAKILFEEARRMVRQATPLRRRLDVREHLIISRSNFGKFEPLSSDANSLDGLNPHFALVDELHAHKTSEVWDVLNSAVGSRSQPLIWAITTAGFNRGGVCYEVRDYAVKVLTDVVEDDSFFSIIFTIDDGDEWQNEDVWAKPNPNLNVSVYLDYLRSKAKQAKEMPTALTNFLTKHLNVWVTGESLWCNIERWKQCGQDYALESLQEAKAVYAGLDLSSVSDLTSLGLVGLFDDGSWKAFSKHYLPEDTVRDRLRKNPAPFDTWARQGWLTLTPGNVCDYNWIKADIEHLLEILPLKEIAFDRWNSSQLVNDLMEMGAPMIAFGQGYASMNAPMKELERRYLSNEIDHPNDPVLTWAMSNVVAQQDPAGNIKPAKDKSSEKIDPAVALMMAVGRALPNEAPGPSIYEERGVIGF